jgi:hypothetical protein
MNLYDYYSEQSKVSSPASYGYLFDDLPNDIPSLCYIVQGLIMHYADEAEFKYRIPKNRYREMDSRHVENMLHLLNKYDNESLTKKREVSKRMIGACRDTSLLLCSILRYKKIPARLRIGFCNYVIPKVYLDNIYVEYWNNHINKWCYVDTRTPLNHIKKFNLNFNLYDVPGDWFVSAARVWQLCRENKVDPNIYGSRDRKGLRYISGRLVQELAILNKKEMLLWDYWGLMLSNPNFDDYQFEILDNLSIFINTKAYDVSDLQSYYKEHEILKIPKFVTVYNPFCEKMMAQIDEDVI